MITWSGLHHPHHGNVYTNYLFRSTGGTHVLVRHISADFLLLKLDYFFLKNTLDCVTTIAHPATPKKNDNKLYSAFVGTLCRHARDCLCAWVYLGSNVQVTGTVGPYVCKSSYSARKKSMSGKDRSLLVLAKLTVKIITWHAVPW